MNKNSKEENTLRPIITVSKTPINTPLEYFVDHNTEWVEELLNEMCENASIFTLKLLKPKCYLNLELNIVKKNNSQMGEFLLVKGWIKSFYATECVKTVRPMMEKLEIEFFSCFLPDRLNAKDQFGETDEIFQDQDMYQIYFYQKNQADLKEMIHEVIYLHYNQYPSIESNGERNADLE